MHTDRFGAINTKSLCSSTTGEDVNFHSPNSLNSSVILPNSFHLVAVVKSNAQWQAVSDTVVNDTPEFIG